MAQTSGEAFLRRVFRLLNKYFMVPAFRLGLGPLIGSPYGGYIMVLRTTGRKSGKIRSAPVNYAIMDGSVYCIAGFGKRTHWYLNLKANPNVAVQLPGRALAGVAEEVTDPDDTLRVARQILQNGGFAGFVYGNPFTMSDDELRQHTQDLPVIRIRPTGVGSGAADPGGKLWLLVLLGSLFGLWRWLRK